MQESAEDVEQQFSDLLNSLMEILSEIGEFLIVEDEDDPDVVTGTRASLAAYTSDDVPIPTHTLTVEPKVTDAGNMSIEARLVHTPVEDLWPSTD
jgi:hypothetical protein